MELWDLTSGKVSRTVEAHTSGVDCVVMMMPSGNEVLSASGDGTLKVWSLGSRGGVPKVAGHAGASPRSHQLLTGDMSSQWDLTTHCAYGT